MKIHSILGDVANVNHRRAWRDGAEFEGVLPRPTYTEEVVFRDARVTDTVAEMKKVIRMKEPVSLIDHKLAVLKMQSTAFGKVVSSATGSEGHKASQRHSNNARAGNYYNKPT